MTRRGVVISSNHTIESHSQFATSQRPPATTSVISSTPSELSSCWTVETSSRSSSCSVATTQKFTDVNILLNQLLLLISSSSTPGSKTPKPQNLRGKQHKKMKYKTEMCQNVYDCKMGPKCHFAHNEEELRYKRVLERDKAGLIDAKTFRTRPCLDHVATGSW